MLKNYNYAKILPKIYKMITIIFETVVIDVEKLHYTTLELGIFDFLLRSLVRQSNVKEGRMIVSSYV